MNMTVNGFAGSVAAILCGAALMTGPLFFHSNASLQKTAPQKPKAHSRYSDPDAYRTYTLALPPTNKMFVVAETTLGPGVIAGADECIQKTEEFGSQFQSVLDNYKEVNSSPKRLVGKWPPQSHVEMISDAGLAKYVDGDNFDWDSYYKQFPQSIGVFRFSAVGFNQDKTKAMFYMVVSGGGGFMGESGFFIFTKVNGNWKELVPSGANYCFVLH